MTDQEMQELSDAPSTPPSVQAAAMILGRAMTEKEAERFREHVTNTPNTTLTEAISAATEEWPGEEDAAYRLVLDGLLFPGLTTKEEGS